MSVEGFPRMPVPWDLICSVKLNALHIAKYRSPETGLELVHTQTDGPLIHASCIIAHKCEDNCGIPHVIQHMVWNGSKSYPHAGLFHKIASKCLSVCPKILTERDHSCYRFSSIGKKGFSDFLPVFLDHIFNPLLQEAAFITEVYHIESSGQDGGTCFNAMKAKENLPDELGMLAMFQIAFGPTSGYSVSHKGISSVFRSECNLEKVRKFHENFYHTSNCCLVVVGDIDKEVLFEALAPILYNLLKGQRVKPSWIKPWLDEPSPSSPRENIIKHIEYPCPPVQKSLPTLVTNLGAHSPHIAHVKIGIIGSRSHDNLDTNLAMRLILEYMKGSISNALSAPGSQSSTISCSIEKNESIVPASLSVHITQYEFKETLFVINCANVPADIAANVPQLIRKTINREMKGTVFKIRKMLRVILNLYQRNLRDTESALEEKITRAVIPDFLYSSHDTDIIFDGRINSGYRIQNLLNKNVGFWKHVIQTWFLDVNWVAVVAMPSHSLFQKLEEEMSDRITWRLERDNIKYTKRWTHRLKAATKLLAKGPPLELVNIFAMPSAETIGLAKISRQINPPWASDTLCNLYVDDINSNYAYLSIIMDTTELTLEQRKYMVLFAEAILLAPYMDNFDKFHTVKECQKELKRDIIGIETFFGLEWIGNARDKSRFSCGTFPHLFCLRIQVEITKVKEGFYWAQMLLWNTKWQAERLKEVSAKLVKDIDELQMKGPIIARTLMTDSLYQMNSTPRCCSLIRQKVFLRQLLDELPKSVKRVSKVLESIRNLLLRPENVTVHLAANLPRMEFHLTENPDARFVISELFRTTFNYSQWNWEYETRRLANNPDRTWMKSADCIKRNCNELIFPLPNTHTACLIQVAPGIQSFTDPEYPLLLLAIQYFIQSPDGPLHKELVLTGAAGELDLRVNPLEGLLYFELRGCTDLLHAYTRVVDLMTRHLLESKEGEGDVKGGGTPFRWDNILLLSAKTSIIFKLAQSESTPAKMAMASFVSEYKEIPSNITRHTMDAITKASMKQVQCVARRYFSSLFLRPTTCSACAQCDRIYPIIELLMQRCGKQLTLVPPLEQSVLASFNH